MLDIASIPSKEIGWIWPRDPREQSKTGRTSGKEQRRAHRGMAGECTYPEMTTAPADSGTKSHLEKNNDVKQEKSEKIEKFDQEKKRSQT